MNTQPNLCLASASPRRQELLRQIGVSFCVCPVDIDESVLPAETPAAYVERLARAKAEAGYQAYRQAAGTSGLPALGADTAVACAGRILGKPRDKADALRMLQSLSGTTHEVWSGVAIASGSEVRVLVSRTEVTFKTLTLAEIERYWESGEPADKAGAYGIQGLGAVFVQEIRGSYSGVVGLPLYETAQLLTAMKIPVWRT